MKPKYPIGTLLFNSKIGGLGVIIEHKVIEDRFYYTVRYDSIGDVEYRNNTFVLTSHVEEYNRQVKDEA